MMDIKEYKLNFEDFKLYTHTNDHHKFISLRVQNKRFEIAITEEILIIINNQSGHIDVLKLKSNSL